MIASSVGSYSGAGSVLAMIICGQKPADRSANIGIELGLEKRRAVGLSLIDISSKSRQF